MSVSAIESEATRLDGCIDGLLREYSGWRARIALGSIGYGLYDEYWEYVNLRLQTVEACRCLLRHDFVPDALGRMRTLLEAFLLLRLMARANKAFAIQDLSSLAPSEFKAKLIEIQEKWRQDKDSGTDTWLDVREYPRKRRHIQYVYEGLRVDGDPGVLISIQWAAFQQFRPETARLRSDSYFEYYKPPQKHLKKLAENRKNATGLYAAFLSYTALLDSLVLNDLLSDQERARVEAHYTFLGKFAHLTHDAERELSEASNVHYGGTGIGLRQPFSRAARLLAYAYLTLLTAGLIDEVLSILEAAPEKYVTRPATEDLRRETRRAVESIRYFWFVYNEASDFDKYLWAIHHATDQQLQAAGGYQNLKSDLITFDQHVWQRFQQMLTPAMNRRCGTYRPPIDGL